ncbi:nuclease-related domain-containing protein [Nocardiopsis sp. CNT312]|uniref:nuclease-related domain-containing protein n=1 Tax=Nocardiopsis sp. CNT312 TaxID=1137268 RepID=UPI0004ADD8FA|nr:nuclease-related domain-containing protein [Nocardiopsis sp. CNT312]
MDGSNLSDVESTTTENARRSPEKAPTGAQRPEDLFFPNKREKKDNSERKPLYGTLKDNKTARRWAVRVAAALATALLVGLLASSWRIGATLGLIVLIWTAVYDMRHRSEVPQWRRGHAAQRKTEAQLKLMKQLGYRVLHARSVPTGDGQIDHFVVGRRGAFTIDSESWDKRLPLRNKLEKLYHGRFSKNERIDEALDEAKRAEELVSAQLGRDISVRPALAIYGPGMPWDSHRLRGVDIITGSKVRRWLRTGRDRMDETEIEEIYEAAKKALPPRY